MKWGIIQDDTCLFCNEHETLQHLFFNCKVVAEVWSKLLMYLHEYHQAKGWEEEARWLVGKGTCKSFKRKLRRLCMTTAIYHIWAARNKRHFEAVEQNCNSIVSRCVADIRACVGS
ncbi:hypothetical protein LIER_43573 [Lithospermum erythrorhizon]|uniref:Reverse transcriptase zinc-binding domain-containing protein n=1 Tax=Lithospermum erythrorhizon TaxID=34254 RepID=A0AAV3QHK0_LITER